MTEPPATSDKQTANLFNWIKEGDVATLAAVLANSLNASGEIHDCDSCRKLGDHAVWMLNEWGIE